MSIFDKFNQKANSEDLAAKIKEVETNGGTGNYEDVPHGEYIVNIEKMEIKLNKNGVPMLSVWFKVLEGNQANRYIFMNQNIEQDFQIHIANEFLRSLDTGLEIKWPDSKTPYDDYADLVLDVHEAYEKLEFTL